MVAPIRELVNIIHTFTTIANISDNLTQNSNINMVIDPLDNIFNIGSDIEEKRGCSLFLSMYKPRSPSISSSECSEEYHVCVKKESNRMDKDKPVNSIGSIKLEYTLQGRQKDQVSKVTDNTNNMFQQCASNEVLTSNIASNNSIFNIQLSYNID